MVKLRKWISAARLRTLPLSVSGIIVGSSAAFNQQAFDWTVFILAICTTISFQILSNFANDYGDGVKGTDNDNRVGPKRAIQSGTITSPQMKKGITITIVITLLLTIALIYKAFGSENVFYIALFFILGLISIAAAIKYTMGTTAYGYYGYGDIFVFLFFGLLSVVGSYFLYTKQINWFVFLPACTVGMMSTAVLNLNNMRDIENDKIVNKNTLVVKMGASLAKYYHYYLLVGAFFFAIMYFIFKYEKPVNFLFIFAFIPIALHIRKVFHITEPTNFDPELKKVALSIFLFSVLFAIGQIL
ncbi:1,4-dihydroxy-2-naphthoate polyprenyltransferase [Leptobacterium sp. I13]|uniref:1,4-dihydroxy-2-naphthoate polyprenyltransferase n=1 Tax=Leptobacterium meishanense TaxID=3128904 RepID=UPI0030EB43DB